MPALAPASMDMLQMVIRASIDSFSIASPRYSSTKPWPPPVPMRAMMARIRSLAVTPAGSSPLTVTAMVLNGAIVSVWVASTCSTCEVPMPNASAPKAPCVEVWLSPQTTVVPGWVRPSCGPTTCTTPCSTSPRGCSRTPKSAQFLRSVSSWIRETGSAMGLSMSRVGVL
jgi:hypothetical protein